MADVAVVIPAFNAATTIAQTLRSVLAQTLPPAEIVVVDDGSDDATGAIVGAMAREDARVRLLRQRKGGPSQARNAGIAATRAPLIAPLDADDLWAPDYLAACHSALDAAADAGFAYAWHHLIDEEGHTLRGPMRFTVQGPAFGPMLLVNFVGNGSSAVFRRDALAEAGGYRPPLPDWPGAEDYLLQLRVAARRPVACVPRDLVAYRKAAATLSADPGPAHRARLAAVRCALDEFGPSSLPVDRWVRGDACRVLAVTLVAKRAWTGAGALAFQALAADPLGTLADLRLRARNLVHRRRGARQGVDRPIDPQVLARIARLARAMPFGCGSPPAG